MELRLPRYVLQWVDSNKGRLSREQFIVNSLIKLLEVQEGRECVGSEDVIRMFEEILKR